MNRLWNLRGRKGLDAGKCLSEYLIRAYEGYMYLCINIQIYIYIYMCVCVCVERYVYIQYQRQPSPQARGISTEAPTVYSLDGHSSANVTISRAPTLRLGQEITHFCLCIEQPCLHTIVPVSWVRANVTRSLPLLEATAAKHNSRALRS